MNIVFLSLLIILSIAIITTLIILIIKIEKDNKEKTKLTLHEVLELRGFCPAEIHFINKFLSIAVNSNYTKLAFVRNFNPNNPISYEYFELATSFIEKIEKNIGIKIHYIKKGELQAINIYPTNQEIKNFIHDVYLKANIKKIEAKYPQIKFTNFASSDWECSYVWAYNKFLNDFAYLKTDEKQNIRKFNLKKEHITIDTKYKYLEVPLYGIAQQLSIFEGNFLENIYQDLLSDIKSKYNNIADNSIYYDSFNNIAFLTNGTTSLQTVIFNKINEIQYRDNRIVFELKNDERVINFTANSQLVSDFEDFITNLNLKTIAQSFDQQTDKVINATHYTKLIIDFSRDRIVYCANLNKLSSFNYMVISFGDVYNIKVEKSGMKHFVRIITRNKEILDITCDKKEIAQYIEANIVKILG